MPTGRAEGGLQWLVGGQVVVVLRWVAVEGGQLALREPLAISVPIPFEPVDREALGAVDPAADRQHHVAVIVVVTARVSGEPVSAGEGRTDDDG
jgi:hypothetical protein